MSKSGAQSTTPTERNNGHIPKSQEVSSGWFIDDDERFPSQSSRASSLAQQQTVKNESAVEAEASRPGITAIGSSWCRPLKKPQSLSNVATALASNGFPSLSSETKPNIGILPSGSAWSKKSRTVFEVSAFGNFKFSFGMFEINMYSWEMFNSSSRLFVRDGKDAENMLLFGLLRDVKIVPK
ncbi:unnamed protein product [Gongylonema pulchrum]|uniref:Uncharacterized protein n=1 Tax=Gongylonema pulchrum TaxID=637853 RepID=A0A183DHY4_9BILA|nr:unnamed protein product [Gongylonema pulchrum]